jgi:hypothetical protein
MFGRAFIRVADANIDERSPVPTRQSLTRGSNVLGYSSQPVYPSNDPDQTSVQFKS